MKKKNQKNAQHAMAWANYPETQTPINFQPAQSAMALALFWITNNNTMKPLSETLTELGIDFTFPIEINDANGRLTYIEYSNGYWHRYERDDNGRATYLENSDSYWEKYERDADGRPTYHENSNGLWQEWVRDANGDVDYYEDSTGVKKGTPKSTNQ